MGGTLDQRDLKRRHPLCPACGYDLVATLAADKRICPECGEAFSPSQLQWERRPEDWSVATAVGFGVRALAKRLLVATIVAALLSAATLWLADLDSPRGVLFLFALVQTVLLGRIISKGLLEAAGFESLFLIIGACAAAVLAAAIGGVLATLIVDTPKGALVLLLHMILSIFGAWVWIIHYLIMDAQ